MIFDPTMSRIRVTVLPAPPSEFVVAAQVKGYRLLFFRQSVPPVPEPEDLPKAAHMTCASVLAWTLGLGQRILTPRALEAHLSNLGAVEVPDDQLSFPEGGQERGAAGLREPANG